MTLKFLMKFDQSLPNNQVLLVCGLTRFAVYSINLLTLLWYPLFSIYLMALEFPFRLA